MEILRDLRLGTFDVLVGINLLREGLDLPEVALVAVLDADKEGFLRSTPSLIQTVGRAARNLDGRAIFYADRVTKSMQAALDEMERRRAAQLAFNEEHGVVPETVSKQVRDLIDTTAAPQPSAWRGKGKVTSRKATTLADRVRGRDLPEWDGWDAERLLGHADKLEAEMRAAAEELEFERAARLRDEVSEIRERVRAV